MKRVNIAIAVAAAAGIGAIVATIWVGAGVREETVVARPYEDGLRQDAERHARAALGLDVLLVPGAAPGQLAFDAHDGTGRPVEDGEFRVSISRPETSRGERAAVAVPAGGGRWIADLAFPDPGPWDVRFDYVRGAERVRVERRVDVRAGCDLATSACARALDGGGEVVLELSPKPLRAMQELAVRVGVRGGDPAPAAPRAVAVSFSMPGMKMGENRARLRATASGRWEGKAVLVPCASGRRDWIADVELTGGDGRRRGARFALTLAEERR
ncbi:MAG TPA: FixH family protein [Anaeromyxobacter sp.]|nr:FixH family protein [Anaeromyxobacter sp.]